jgi:hypothetical protein
VAALFAVAMSFAPASAHPGHADHGPHVAAHRHVDATPASAKAVASVESAMAQQAATFIAISAVVSVASSLEDGCHGACCCGAGCCGMGCCMACIVGQSPTLSLNRAAVGRAQAPERALSSIEPDSLLEPPNASA